MARGTIDGGYDVSSSPTTQVTDPGEMTNRLLMAGGANSRSGRWMWATGFESSLAEVGNLGGTFTTLDKTLAYQGLQCLKMQTAPLMNNVAFIWKNLFSPFSPDADSIKIGEEFMVLPIHTGNPFQVFSTIAYPIGNTSNHYRFRFRLSVPGWPQQRLDIWTGGAWVNKANVDLYANIGQNVFHNIKIVGDAKNGKYDYLIFDNIVIDLSAVQADTVIGVNTPGHGISYEVYLETLSANVATCYLDNWILTGDEP